MTAILSGKVAWPDYSTGNGRLYLTPVSNFTEGGTVITSKTVSTTVESGVIDPISIPEMVYIVKLVTDGRAPVRILANIPAGPVTLADITPVEGSPVPIVRGPEGPAGQLGPVGEIGRAHV